MSVNVILINHVKETIESNIKSLMPIVKTILFCARHNLPLRGHHEQGKLVSSYVRNAC